MPTEIPQSITLADAITMTQRYRDQKDQILKPEYQGMGILPLAEAFDIKAIQALLNEEGCEKIRVYLGMKDNLHICAILVGVDANGNDIIPTEETQGKNVIIEDGQRCPDYCPVNSPLMS